MLPSEIGTSVSPLKYQLKSASPPSPRPFSGLSFGPATKPSSDIVILKTTLSMRRSLLFFQRFQNFIQALMTVDYTAFHARCDHAIPILNGLIDRLRCDPGPA